MKKKVAVVFNRMIVGGAEKSLIQFLCTIDLERYDVTLFTLDRDGAFFEDIPRGIHVVFTRCGDTAETLRNDIKHLRLIKVLKGMILRILARFSKNDYARFALPMMTYPKLPGYYDCGIAYKLGCEDVATLLIRVCAERKCGLVHHIVDRERDGGVFQHMGAISKIFCVSEYAKAAFDGQYPHLSYKTDVLHNIVDAVGILSQAQEVVAEPLRKPALLTVGRFDKEKGQDMIPRTTRLLLDAGYDVNWYLVGDGALRQTVLDEITKYQVEEHVILLGTKRNPYPYVKNCDIYVQTSRTEGWCLTTQEASILCKPIVTTDLPVMREQFIDGVNGSIAKGSTPEALAAAIEELLDQPELRKKYIAELRKASYDGVGELQKLYDFIEG